MAVKEGLCPNCGSLMRFDDTEEKARCIFCWAEVDSAEGLALAEDSTGYEFPNEHFSEPDAVTKAKAIQAQGFGGVGISAAANQVQRKQPKAQAGKLTPREKVALQNKPLVKPYCSKRHILCIAAGVAAVVIVLVLLAIPLYFIRNDKKQTIKAKLPAVISFAGDENRVNIQRQSNQLITLISPDKVEASEAKQAFEDYAKVYAEVYGISEEQAKAKIEVRYFDSEQGGYKVRVKNNVVVATAYSDKNGSK